MSVFLQVLGATVVVSLLAFIGVLTLALKEKLLNKIVLLLVALSAGTMMGGAFLHLLPEAAESGGSEVFAAVLAGFVFFLFMERVLHWRHCHKGKCDVHTFGYMSLIGDGVHNFTDGLIIAASFLSDVNLGVAATLAIAFHEIPQEIGDFGVLVHSGFDKYKALGMNFGVALAVVAGGIVGLVISENFVSLLIPIAAGGFIYVGASDLLPQIRKVKLLKDSVLTFGVFVLGILIMYGAKVLF